MDSELNSQAKYPIYILTIGQKPNDKENINNTLKILTNSYYIPFFSTTNAINNISTIWVIIIPKHK